MKVLFLDFNGILDTWYDMNHIQYDNLQRLKKIIRVTGAKIVISSSIKNNYWRHGTISGSLRMLLDRLISEGLEVVGFTPYADTREHEIMIYLHEHPEVENYVILDDDYDMEELREHLVKLPCQNIGKSQIGLQDVHAEEAIRILGRLPEEEIKKKEVVPKLKKIPKEN